MFLLSMRAGLRAAEIAQVEWQMVLDANGKIADVMNLEDRIAKKKSGRQIVNLNPPDRRQNKKFRATVREARVLRGWLDKWEETGLDAYGERYCGYATIEGVKTALQVLRERESVNLPLISTYSFRHKVTTVLRQGRVSEDQVSQMLGHRRVNLRTTGGYGEWSPDYLADAAAAIDAWFLRVQQHCSRDLFSHGNPTKRPKGKARAS
jgi:integrase